MSNKDFPLFPVPDEGLPLFDGFEYRLDDLEREIREILWSLADRLGELKEWTWMVEGTLEKGSLRTVVRVAAVELNHCGVLADGMPPVDLQEDTVTCYVPEDCTELWRETVVWHAVVATVTTLSEKGSNPVSDRLWSQTRPRMVEAWTELSKKLGVGAPVLDVW